ncbi:MAG: ATP-binding protein [Planctomycetes bacterium]|nr:ATP-binding protein [Planctomycetota bacterium]
MNRLLERQLRRFSGSVDAPPADWTGFLAAIGEAYDQATKDRLLLERSMDLVSQELLDRNARLTKEIQERLRAESELRLAQKLESVGQLASGIAHEINTPIQYVGDSVAFIRSAFEDVGRYLAAVDDLVGEVSRARTFDASVQKLAGAREAADLAYVREQVPDAIGRIEDGISRVSKIVRAMREFAHPDQSEMVLADINHGVRNTLVVATNEYKYCADIECELGELPEVSCHPGEINQVLLNLIVNAAHAIADRWQPLDRRGTIRVTTRAVAGGVQIEVADNGCGIPDEIKQRIFDPFFTTKEVGRGTGQGLALARTIVGRHEGKLEFDSLEGVGTTFRVWLPNGLPNEVVTT